jgi:hypothetical protein
MIDRGVGQLADLDADVGAHRRVRIAVVRHDMVGALRHQHDVAGHDRVGNRALVAGLELAAFVKVKRNLPLRDARIADSTFDA